MEDIDEQTKNRWPENQIPPRSRPYQRIQRKADL